MSPGRGPALRQALDSLQYRLTKRLAGSATVQMVPAPMRRAVRLLMDAPIIAALSEDRRSFRRLGRLWVHDPTTEPVAVRLKGFGRDPVVLRPGTADLAVARDLALAEPHLIGDDGDAPKRRIWDLGAHIGLASRQYALRHADAHVTGVELDPENAGMYRRNLAPFADRCEVVQAAVWTDDGGVTLKAGDAIENNARSVSAGGDAEGGSTVPSVSLNTLAGRAAGEPIDFCKMDIEGAERNVLRENVEWAGKVQTISVEVHGSYTAQECAEDLRRLGFHPMADHAVGLVLGTRRPPADV